MNFEALKSYEPSLTFVEGDREALSETISHTAAPLSGSFFFIKKKKFLDQGLAHDEKLLSKVGAIFEKKFWEKAKESFGTSPFSWIATVENVDHAMSRLSKPFYAKKFDHLNYFVDGRQMNSCEIHPDAEIAQGVFIGENCKISAGVKIYPGAVIQPEVEIGENTVIYPNVNIYPYTKIGNNCRIHSGTVIGTDGFGYNFFEGAHHKVWHFGGVEIANDVEIGCNAMLDAGTFSPTFIGNGSKIDNDVQISHNVIVHEHVIICGTTGIAGSVEISDYCAFGAGAGVAPSAFLGKGVQVAARAVVSENAKVEDGTIMAGHPARPLKEWLKTQANLRSLNKK